MKVTFITKSGDYTIGIFYVWDRDDKFLIVNDEVKKIKYVPDTYKSNFEYSDVMELISEFAEKVLGLKDFSWKPEGTVTECCHNDEYEFHYKKGYKFVGPKECPFRY